MGVIMDCICQNCGTIAKEIYYGPGFVCCQEPIVCKDCGFISHAPLDEQTGKIKEKYSQCRKCGGTNVEIWDHKCPKCGSDEVEDECVGLWD